MPQTYISNKWNANVESYHEEHRICIEFVKQEAREKVNKLLTNKLLLIKFEPRFRFDKLMQLMHSNCTYIYKFNEANLINAWNIYYIYPSKEREREIDSNSNNRKFIIKSDFDLKNETSMLNPSVGIIVGTCCTFMFRY